MCLIRAEIDDLITSMLCLTPVKTNGWRYLRRIFSVASHVMQIAAHPVLVRFL